MSNKLLNQLPQVLGVFDKAIVYESPELSEGIVMEFPELTSSTRRDHWLAIIKEIILMHQFLSKYKVECPLQAWEMNARTILSIIWLHAAREMLRISPPDPKKFLIFALYDELPKGDYVLEELAERLKKVNCGHPCSASSILRSMNLSIAACSEVKEEKEQEEHKPISNDSSSPLQSAINQSREEAKEIDIAKSTTDGLKGEGISDSIAVLLELLKPLKSVLQWIQEVVLWERPVTILTVLAATPIIVYKEWFGLAIAACLLTIVAKMIQARKKRLPATR